MRRALAVLIAIALAPFAAAGVARAQAGIEVTNNTAESSFPDGVAFTLDAELAGPPDDVRLVYRIAPDGVRTTAVPECTGTTVLHCTYLLANTLRNPLIPGAEITYSWTIDAGADTHDTIARTITYEDTRFDWQSLTDGNITIWWYDAGEDEARAVLAAGRESMDRIGALLRTRVTFPVKIFYYASAREMQPAIAGDNPDDIITLGEVASSDTAMVAADAAPEDIARHEIAHIVHRQAMRGPYEDNLPAWLAEGVAVWAQSEPLSGERRALESAIRTGQVLSVRSLSSASSRRLSERVFLFYGQSWSLVKFLIDTYGEDKFAQLFAALKSGDTTAGALQQVYGFDQDGLENAWRASIGLPARTPVGETTETALPSATATSPSSDDGGGANTGLIVAVIAATAILAGGFAAAGVFLARRYR